MNKWTKGMIVSAAGGAVTFLADPHSIVKDPATTLKVAGIGALIALIAYLAKSPMEEPKPKQEDPK